MQSLNSSAHLNMSLLSPEFVKLARKTYPADSEHEAVRQLCERAHRSSTATVQSIESARNRNQDDEVVLRVSKEALEIVDAILAT